MPTETYTSRERVIRTLNRQPVDRYPIDLGSHMSTGISAFAYWNLRKYLGLSTDRIWLPDLVQMLAYVDEDVVTRFHLDCMLLETPWPVTRRWNPRGAFGYDVPAAFDVRQNPDGDWVVRQGEESMRMPAGGYFFDGGWISNWGGLDEEAWLACYAREAERIYKETPYATNFVGYSYGGGFGAFFGGIDEAIAMVDDPQDVLDRHKRLWSSISTGQERSSTALAAGSSSSVSTTTWARKIAPCAGPASSSAFRGLISSVSAISSTATAILRSLCTTAARSSP